MMRWLAPVLAAAFAACIYGNDIKDEWDNDSSRMSCMGHWDCLFDEDVCGSIVSQPNGENGTQLCPQEDGWLGVDEWDVRWGESFDDQPNIRFTCIDDTRYFPVCSRPDKLECDGDSCPDKHACAIRVANPDKKAYCVSTEGMGGHCGDSTECAGDICVRFFEYTEEGANYHNACVAASAIQL